MKSMRYLLAISLVIVPIVVSACGYPWTVYNRSSLFRLDDANSHNSSMREANCREWQMLTDRNIPLGDIEHVVYEMPIEEYEAFCAKRVCDLNNAFAQWIKHNDPEIVEFLLLAKRNEEIRFRYSSKWYYPSMKVGGPMTLEDVVEQALAADSEPLRDRYLLQAMRALSTLGRYKECLELWNQEVSALPEDNLMRQHMLPLIASAYYYTGEVEKAMTIYASIGDISSMRYIANLESKRLSDYDIIEYSYRSGVRLSHFQDYVRDMIVDAETFPYVIEDEDKPVISDELVALRDLALVAGNDTKCSDRAEWLYIAAYIYTQQGLCTKAKPLAIKAATLASSDTLKDSIRVLNIYLDALTSSYDSSYDARLYDNLLWLESKIKRELDDANTYYWESWIDFTDYYWCSSLSRICNYAIAPRYMQKGNTSRALQIMNYAEYIIYDIVPYYYYYYYSDDYDYYWGVSNIDEYRRNSYAFNYLDYSNRFFETIDSQTPDVAIAYVEHVKNSTSELDRHLNEIGYTSDDYLYDIVGTLCLRYMRYEEAARYLSLVSLEYEDMLNVDLDHDPFVVFNGDGEYRDFRYRFAVTMASLEQGINTTTDQNRRAQLLLRFGIGMSNSVNICWPLTHYGRGCDRPWGNDAITLEARSRGIKCVNEALCSFTDDEYAAQAHYALGHYRTVALEYGYTEAGKYVQRHCDNYVDYIAPMFKSQSY